MVDGVGGWGRAKGVRRYNYCSDNSNTTDSGGTVDAGGTLSTFWPPKHSVKSQLPPVLLPLPLLLLLCPRVVCMPMLLLLLL